MLSPCKQTPMHLSTKAWCLTNQESNAQKTLLTHIVRPLPWSSCLAFPSLFSLSWRQLLLFPQNTYHRVSWHPLTPRVPAKPLLVSQVLQVHLSSNELYYCECYYAKELSATPFSPGRAGQLFLPPPFWLGLKPEQAATQRSWENQLQNEELFINW